MSWRDAAIGLGHLMKGLGRGRQPRDGSVAFRGMWVGGFATSAVLLFGVSAGAGDSYPAPGFFADGMTAQSTWAEIQKKPWSQVEFPYVGFGTRFVAISGVCATGHALAITDPYLDNGVRVSINRARPQVPGDTDSGRYAAAQGGPAADGSRTPAVTRSPGEGPDRIQYDVNVYRTLPGINPHRALLFQKPWSVSTCPSP